MINQDANKNPGNLRNGLAQSSMIKSLVHSNSPVSPLWKAEQRCDTVQREAEIAKQVGLSAPRTSPVNNHKMDGSSNNFGFWLRGGAAEG